MSETNSTYTIDNIEVEINREAPNEKAAGKSNATASLVLGIISIASTFTGIGALLGIVLGIIGISQGNKAMKLGFEGGTAKAGKICSIVGLCISGLVVVFCILGIGLIAGGAGLMAAAF